MLSFSIVLALVFVDMSTNIAVVYPIYFCNLIVAVILFKESLVF